MTIDPSEYQDIMGAHNDVVRLERLTHHIARIRESQDEMRRGQEELRVSLKEMASALTRLVLVEERQSTANTAIERLALVTENLDDRLRKLEIAEPMQAKTSEWVMSALWAAGAAAVMFIAAKAGLFG